MKRIDTDKSWVFIYLSLYISTYVELKRWIPLQLPNYYFQYAQVKRHLDWKVVLLQTNRSQHLRHGKRATVQLMPGSTVLLLEEKRELGHRRLMIRISGFKWTLAEMSKSQSLPPRDDKTTNSGSRATSFPTVKMVERLSRHIKRIMQIRWQENMSPF